MEVTRAASPTLLPWEQWPDRADGKGIVVASALNGGSLAGLEGVPDADFTTADPHYFVNLCVAPATGLKVYAHLDETNDGSEPLTYSSSYYPDFCGPGSYPACFRCFTVNVAAAETVHVDFPLSQSCD